MGGSGGAGKVNYPSYLERIHEEWLDNTGLDLPSASITDVFNALYNNSPFALETAYDPDVNLTAMQVSIDAFSALVSVLNPELDYTNAMNSGEIAVDGVMDTAYLITPVDEIVVDPNRVVDDVAGYANSQTDLLEANTLVAFKAGMLNINAVTASSFVIGEAILRAFAQRDVARYEAELRLRLATQNDELNARFIIQRNDQVAKHHIQRNTMIQEAANTIVGSITKKAELTSSVSGLTIEQNRMHIVAKTEEKKEQLLIDESDAKWNMDLFQPVANFMAGPGGAAMPATKKPHMAVSALAGGLSGAAAGAQVGASTGVAGGGVYGAAIGAVVGAGIGLLQAQ